MLIQFYNLLLNLERLKPRQRRKVWSKRRMVRKITGDLLGEEWIFSCRFININVKVIAFVPANHKLISDKNMSAVWTRSNIKTMVINGWVQWELRANFGKFLIFWAILQRFETMTQSNDLQKSKKWPIT